MDENAAVPPTTPAQPRPTQNAGPSSRRFQVKPINRYPTPRKFSVWKAFETVLSIALLVATLFTLWTPANLFSNDLLDQMFKSVQPPANPEQVIVATNTPAPKLKIGIVSGHWGNDSGSVCDDGLTEMQVNLEIATQVQALLTKEGYDVEILQEFDDRLQGYKASALVSIHNDSCQYVNDEATGFKVAAATSNTFPEKSSRLTACLTQRYQAITGLPFHYNTVTRDMTEYHAFNEIDSSTTAAIIETGFLYLDREILTQHTDKVAQGVASGILCFVRNENIPQLPTLAP